MTQRNCPRDSDNTTDVRPNENNDKETAYIFKLRWWLLCCTEARLGSSSEEITG